MKTRTTRLKFALGTLICASFLCTGHVMAWGPERPTYTNDSPARYATFNSITDNAAVGDERNFVRVGEVGSSTAYTDELEIVPGKEYEVYIYYHNDAASNTNSSGFGIATNTHIASAYPVVLNPGDRGMVSGIVTWSYVTPEDPNNAQTGTVWDEAYLTTKYDNVVLRYKTGTATIHNGGKANGSVLPTNLFTQEGTPIGFNKLTGTIPGCAEYSGYITYTLVAEKTSSTLEKKVSLDGKNWSNTVTAKPGSYVTYQVIFKNTGNTNMANVIFKDVHSEGLSLRSGSTKVYDVNNVNGKVIDDIIDISGYNTGTAAAGALIQIIYQARVSKDKSFCGQSLNNTMTVRYNTDGSNESGANVIVSGEEPTDEDCKTNPNLPGCNNPTDEDCKTNPNLPGCTNSPDNPDNPDSPDDPDTPQEIVRTGPLEIIMAIIIVLGIGFGGLYYYRTHKTLAIVKKQVSGNGNDTNQKTNSTDGNENSATKQ